MFTHYFRVLDGSIVNAVSEFDSAEIRKREQGIIERTLKDRVGFSNPEVEITWIATVETTVEEYKIPKLAQSARELSTKIKDNVAIFQKSKKKEPNCVALSDAISDTRKLLKLLSQTLNDCQDRSSLIAGDRALQAD